LLAGNCQKHGERLWRRPMRGLPGWVGVVSEYFPGDTLRQGKGTCPVPLSPSAPPQKGDTPWIQCKGGPLQHLGVKPSLARPFLLSPFTARPPGRGGGQRRWFDLRCRRQGRFSIDKLPWKFSCVNTTPSPRSCFCPRPTGGWRKGSFALCSVTEPWCSGSRISAAMPGR
jgi:hypothetical protein